MSGPDTETQRDDPRFKELEAAASAGYQQYRDAMGKIMAEFPAGEHKVWTLRGDGRVFKSVMPADDDGDFE